MTNGQNRLRPEAAESLFVLWRVTGNETYRDWGWHMFRAFEMHTRVATGGNAGVQDVRVIPAPKKDHMEGFYVAETLKYLLLLFSDRSVRVSPFREGELGLETVVWRFSGLATPRYSYLVHSQAEADEMSWL